MIQAKIQDKLYLPNEFMKIFNDYVKRRRELKLQKKIRITEKANQILNQTRSPSNDGLLTKRDNKAFNYKSFNQQ